MLLNNLSKHYLKLQVIIARVNLNGLMDIYKKIEKLEIAIANKIIKRKNKQLKMKRKFK